MNVHIFSHQPQRWQGFKHTYDHYELLFIDFNFVDMAELTMPLAEFIEDYPEKQQLFIFDCTTDYSDKWLAFILEAETNGKIHDSIFLHESKVIFNAMSRHHFHSADRIISANWIEAMEELRKSLAKYLLEQDPIMKTILNQPDHIRYFKKEKGSHYLEVHYKNDGFERVRASLKHFIYLQPLFDYYGRSYLVNKNYILYQDRLLRSLILKDGQKLSY
ncbi:MAG: LytTR family DNA-binding domain-containing protein [Facklamia hominis]